MNKKKQKWDTYDRLDATRWVVFVILILYLSLNQDSNQIRFSKNKKIGYVKPLFRGLKRKKKLRFLVVK